MSNGNERRKYRRENEKRDGSRGEREEKEKSGRVILKRKDGMRESRKARWTIHGGWMEEAKEERGEGKESEAIEERKRHRGEGGSGWGEGAIQLSRHTNKTRMNQPSYLYMRTRLCLLACLWQPE